MYLQAVLKEFDPTTAANKDILVRYFRERLYPSIQAQLDNRVQDQDVWDKVIEKAIDVKAKISLQLSFKTRKIDSRYTKSYKPLVKKDKNDIDWEHQDEVPKKNKDKTKFDNVSFTNNQPQIQAFEKEQCHGNRWGHSVTEVNTTEVAKNEKDKVKNLSHIKWYTYKQKGHYTNKCLK